MPRARSPMRHALCTLWLASSASGLRISRSDLLRTLPAAAISPLLPQPAFAGEPGRPLVAGDTYYQSDDKSFDFIAPPGWKVAERGFGQDAGADPRRFFPTHVFKVAASDGKGSAVDVSVDLGYGTSIADLGSLEAAAAKLAGSLGLGDVTSVSKVSGAVRGSTYLVAATKDGKTLRAAVVSKRLYAMVGSGPKADAVLETFQAWPTNIFCQTTSNAGNVPSLGTCY